MPQKAQNLRTLMRVVQEFRVIDNDLPVSYASIFLYIAQHRRLNGEDPSVASISNALGIAQPAMSRATQALSDRKLGNNPAPDVKAPRRRSLGLIERRQDDVDLRMMRCRLSDKGKALLHRLEDHLEG
jgi:DNA-binding MarR family transcriptional regulator